MGTKKSIIHTVVPNSCGVLIDYYMNNDGRQLIVIGDEGYAIIELYSNKRDNDQYNIPSLVKSEIYSERQIIVSVRSDTEGFTALSVNSLGMLILTNLTTGENHWTHQLSVKKVQIVYPFTDIVLSWSPDGQYIAYSHDGKNIEILRNRIERVETILTWSSDIAVTPLGIEVNSDDLSVDIHFKEWSNNSQQLILDMGTFIQHLVGILDIETGQMNFY